MSFRLYRNPSPNEFFVCGADPAEGNDYCAAQFVSKGTQEVILTFQARMESSQFGYELYKGAKFIYNATGNWPTIGVERNTGQATIARLLDLNYPALYHHTDTTRDQASTDKRIGWPTNTATRPMMLDDLALALRQGLIHIYDRPTLKELRSFIRHPKTGKPEAEVGAHDDLVMSLAIAWQLYQRVPTPTKSHGAVIQEANRLFDAEGFY